MPVPPLTSNRITELRMIDGDVTLLERLRDHDEQHELDDALGQLVERYQHELVGFFYHHIWDQSTAEDLAQTVFIKLFQARKRYQVQAKVRTYIYRIAHNVWIDHLRRKRPTISLDQQRGPTGRPLSDSLAAKQADVIEQDEQEFLRQHIQDAVDQLSDGHREVFVMANNQGLAYPDISDILGIPVGTVKSRMYHAVRQLREALKDVVDA